MSREPAARTRGSAGAETLEQGAEVRRGWTRSPLDTLTRDRDGVKRATKPQLLCRQLADAVCRRGARDTPEPRLPDLPTGERVAFDLRRGDRAVLDARAADPHGRIR